MDCLRFIRVFGLVCATCFFALPLQAAPDAAADPFANELKELMSIGYESFGESVRVFVRTSDPVKYTVDTTHPRRIVLILDNCRVPLKNNTRAMNTRFFDGPVMRIQAKPVENPSASVHIEITLRHPTPIKPIVQDTYLALEFQKAHHSHR